MPLFGKPQLGQQRKPFDLAEQNGEQVDAVRSKIASLMDGVTEKRAAAHAVAAAETAQPPHAPQSDTSLKMDETLPAAVNSDERSNNREPSRKAWLWQDQEAEQSTSLSPHAATNEQKPSLGPTQTEDLQADKVRMGSLQDNESDPVQWPRRPNNSAESHTPENDTPTDITGAAAQPKQRSWSLPPLFDAERPRAIDHAEPIAHQANTATNGQSSVRREGATGNVATAAASRGQPPAISTINIKGRAGGILVEIGKGHWPDLLVALAERLAGAGNFFRNGAVALDLAERSLSEPELRQVHEMFTEQTLELVLVRTASPETFQVALDMGLAAQLETPEGQTTTAAQPAVANLADEHHFVYAGHLRAGQVLQRREHILVIGDVNPGATVISDGDILVWGNLRGMAQAGASGDAKAVVAALNLIPVQLRISDFIAIAPEPKFKRGWGYQRSPVKQPEVAYLNQDRIVVEPWDATKFGGIAALRQ